MVAELRKILSLCPNNQDVHYFIKWILHHENFTYKKIETTMKNCKICKKEIKAEKDYCSVECLTEIKAEKDYCSVECFTEWLSTTEGDMFLNEMVSRNTTWYKIQIKQHRNKIKLFEESLKELEIELLEKVGETEFNSLMSELENEVDEESDYKIGRAHV